MVSETLKNAGTLRELAASKRLQQPSWLLNPARSTGAMNQIAMAFDHAIERKKRSK
jgi:hypothetical protein